jgi:hypothetical protein
VKDDSACGDATHAAPPRSGVRAETPSARVWHGGGAESAREGLGTYGFMAIPSASSLLQTLVDALVLYAATRGYLGHRRLPRRRSSLRPSDPVAVCRS